MSKEEKLKNAPITEALIDIRANLPSGIVQKFYTLASTWKAEVRFSSSITEMAMHPTYQRIIGMGPVIIPLLLEELELRPDHWFWALEAITGEDPVKPEHYGRLKEMAEDWLKWSKEKGYS